MSETVEAELDQLNKWWRQTQSNVLVIGPEEAVANVVATLGGMCRKPVVTCRATMPLRLPDPSPTGALILQGVADVPLEGQRLLMEWLDEAGGRTPVIATATDSLLPRLETGTFLDSLYYRLNTVYIDLTGHPRQPHDGDEGAPGSDHS